MGTNKYPVKNAKGSTWLFLARLGPAIVTTLGMVALVMVVILQAEGEPLALARLGSRYYAQNPNGTQGYDGQFVYYIAREPDPSAVASMLDVPAYRYQRILLPLLSRIFCLGNVACLPWAIIVLTVGSHFGGTWAVSELLGVWGVNRWYALVYGLWAGFSLAIRLDLPEPMAYGLVAAGILAHEQRRKWLGWLLFGLGVFAKEVILLYVVAYGLMLLSRRRWRELVAYGLITVVPFAIFQLWLWKVFGGFGLGSGGAMATSFEIVPFMGLLRIADYSRAYLLAMAVVFTPVLVLPTLWALHASAKQLIAGQPGVVVLALFLNALAIPFLPFSTFRETGGLLRYASGLVLAVLLFAARYRRQRALNYSLFWMVMNVFLLKPGGF